MVLMSIILWVGMYVQFRVPCLTTDNVLLKKEMSFSAPFLMG